MKKFIVTLEAEDILDLLASVDKIYPNTKLISVIEVEE